MAYWARLLVTYFSEIIPLNSHTSFRSHAKNSCFVFHKGFQTPRNNKSTRPAASCFHLFLDVWNPWWNTRTRFWHITSNTWQLLIYCFYWRVGIISFVDDSRKFYTKAHCHWVLFYWKLYEINFFVSHWLYIFDHLFTLIFKIFITIFITIFI